MGCRRDTGQDHLRTCLDSALRESGFHLRALREIRTVEAKKDEAGLLELARQVKVPLIVVPDEVLLGLTVSFSESAAQKHLGLPGAAEPAAASGGRLLGPRRVLEGVTVAFARGDSDLVGEVAVVGTGPGDVRYLTLEARETLEKADFIVGYRLYVEQLPAGWLENKSVESYRMGEEEDRVRRAISLAEQGYRVALVCGGDPVLFGLGALTRRLSSCRVPARIVPGLSAAQLAGAMVGAPYTNGLICLSLSDYLQSWDDVMVALKSAAESGTTTALYNPVRRELERKLAAVRGCFGSPERPILLVRDAGRPGAAVREIRLGDLLPEAIDMRTLILIPGKGVSLENGLWLDSRGYRSEKALSR
jgi:cobalt-precorrin 5A hydrolase/precorrin-3B C17-methyltransferase